MSKKMLVKMVKKMMINCHGS